ncbi:MULTISPECIES: hypothetical protein [Streptomyces]|uniref:Secreted protein n=1 Tax=Streptomyces koelreuteriae TaxID=2838015 RepID=A0ABX8G242_9ACTN|nr:MULTISPECIES: hypothetical protein [Streptomyces]QWB27307.1 hypothetical protein KJK29_34515 [Streptomyces koelreuteriae]UUA10392.1 hypothetical protein NNW98_34710 [Streptomyces koelreuteriae]UUA17999.1 hypothetical protein NNW99_34595 [Streptomyces sp. CRCS-T-1]
MSSKQVLTVVVMVAVFAWSTVMTVLGHLAAVAALLPSLGLLVQQIVAALHTTQSPRPTPADTAPTAIAAGPEESVR